MFQQECFNTLGTAGHAVEIVAEQRNKGIGSKMRTAGELTNKKMRRLHKCKSAMPFWRLVPSYNARRIQAFGEYMKKWFLAFVCASTLLFGQNALAAVKFKRFAHCGDGLVTVKTCECHASNSRVWHYCHAGYYCHTFDGSCRK